MKKRNLHHPGLTTVELIVSITLSAIFILGLLPLLFSFFNSLQNSIARAKQLGEMHSAIQAINDDLVRAQSILRLSDIDDDEEITQDLRWSRNKLVWSFEGQNPNKRVLILRVPGTSRNAKDASRELAVHGGHGLCGDSQRHKNATPTFYNAIYFVKDDTLYRRSLLFRKGFPQIAGAKSNDEGTERFLEPHACIEPSQSQTCSQPGKDYGTRCRPNDHWAFPNFGYSKPTMDVAILRNVSTFSIDYFDTPTSTAPTDYYTSLNSTASLEDIRKFTDIPNHPKDIRITITTSIQKHSHATNTTTLSTRGALPW